MKEKTKIKIGIADAHGIESYFDTKGNEEKFLSLHLRASHNRQRHAVFYIAEISEKEDKEIRPYIRENNTKLKRLVTHIRKKWRDSLKIS